MLGGQLPSSHLLHAVWLRLSGASASEIKSSSGSLRWKNNMKFKKR